MIYLLKLKYISTNNSIISDLRKFQKNINLQRSLKLKSIINFSSSTNIFKESPLLMENKKILKYYNTSKHKHDKNLYYFEKLKNQASQKMKVLKNPIIIKKQIDLVKSEIKNNIRHNTQFKNFISDNKLFKTNTKKMYSNRNTNLSQSKFSVNNTILSSHDNIRLYEDLCSLNDSKINTISNCRYDNLENDLTEEDRQTILEKLYLNTTRTQRKEISNNDEYNLYEYFRKYGSVKNDEMNLISNKENIFNDILCDIKRNKNKFHTYNFNKFITPESNYGDKINLKKINQIRYI